MSLSLASFTRVPAFATNMRAFPLRLLRCPVENTKAKRTIKKHQHAAEYKKVIQEAEKSKVSVNDTLEECGAVRPLRITINRTLMRHEQACCSESCPLKELILPSRAVPAWNACDAPTMVDHTCAFDPLKMCTCSVDVNLMHPVYVNDSSSLTQVRDMVAGPTKKFRLQGREHGDKTIVHIPHSSDLMLGLDVHHVIGGPKAYLYGNISTDDKMYQMQFGSSYCFDGEAKSLELNLVVLYMPVSRLGFERVSYNSEATDCLRCQQRSCIYHFEVPMPHAVGIRPNRKVAVCINCNRIVMNCTARVLDRKHKKVGEIDHLFQKIGVHAGSAVKDAVCEGGVDIRCTQVKSNRNAWYISFVARHTLCASSCSSFMCGNSKSRRLCLSCHTPTTSKRGPNSFSRACKHLSSFPADRFEAIPDYPNSQRLKFGVHNILPKALRMWNDPTSCHTVAAQLVIRSRITTLLMFHGIRERELFGLPKYLFKVIIRMALPLTDCTVFHKRLQGLASDYNLTLTRVPPPRSLHAFAYMLHIEGSTLGRSLDNIMLKQCNSVRKYLNDGLTKVRHIREVKKRKREFMQVRLEQKSQHQTHFTEAKKRRQNAHTLTLRALADAICTMRKYPELYETMITEATSILQDLKEQIGQPGPECVVSVLQYVATICCNNGMPLRVKVAVTKLPETLGDLMKCYE